MSVTLSQARTSVYWMLREVENSTAYPYTLVDWFINSAQLRYCSGLLNNPLTKENVTKGKLPFLNKDAYFSNIAPTYTTTDVAVWATTIPATTTNYDTTGTLFIAWNTIPYTGKTSTSFTGCSNVLFAFESGMQISPAFTLPTDFMSPIEIVYKDRMKLDCLNYDEIYEYLKSYKGNYADYNNSNVWWSLTTYTSPFYTIKDSTYLILWNLNQTGGMVHLRYEKLPATLSATTDTLTIPNDTYAKNIITQYAAGEMLFYRWEEVRAAQILNFAIGQAKESYKFYDNQSFETQSGIRFSVGKSGKRNNF